MQQARKSISPIRSENFATFEISSVKYHADPAATPDQLIFDAQLMLEAAAATVDTLACGLRDEGGDIASNPRICSDMLYGVLHQLAMAKGMSAEASNRMRSIGKDPSQAHQGKGAREGRS